MQWSFEDLRRLSRASGVADSTQYQNTLAWKRGRALYQAERAEGIWDELFSAHQTIEVGGQDWRKAQFASEAETEAAVQALHSMADILAQIINLAILNGDLSEREVSFNKVLKQLRERNIAPNVVAAIERLKGSEEFKYINAFCNTIKHRRLLDTDYRVEAGMNARNEEGIRFKGFSYNGDSFPTTWASDITGSYKTTIIDLICDIGNSVNDYLRSQIRPTFGGYNA